MLESSVELNNTGLSVWYNHQMTASNIDPKSARRGPECSKLMTSDSQRVQIVLSISVKRIPWNLVVLGFSSLNESQFGEKADKVLGTFDPNSLLLVRTTEWCYREEKWYQFWFWFWFVVPLFFLRWTSQIASMIARWDGIGWVICTALTRELFCLR